MSSYHRCIVSGCSTKKGHDKTLHRIPKDPNRRNLWLSFLNLPETATGRVCSSHFKPTDFEMKGNRHIWLKRNTFPKRADDDECIEVNLGKIERIQPDTVADLQMNCLVYSICKNSIYEEHNYSKFAICHNGRPGRGTNIKRYWKKFRSRERRFKVTFCRRLCKPLK